MSTADVEAEIEAIVARADALYHDVDLATVREWKEAHEGSKAIGYMPIWVPREIVHAAGMLPVGLHGAGDQVEVIRGDAYFQSYICQIPRSTIEVALTGRYDALDGFLFPAICDVIRNLSGMWKILFPEKLARYLDVPQNFDPQIGGKFFARELEALRDDLAGLRGRPISDDALRASIELYNENRRAIGDLMALREREPWKATATESYLVIRAGDLLPVEVHTAMVRAYTRAAEASDRKMRDHTRVVMTGAFCEQPPLGLIRTLERAGTYIVWDDMTLGARWPMGDVSLEGDPVAALATAFITDSPATASKYEPTGGKGAPLCQITKKTKAEGVILAAPSFCDPALLDQPMLTGALDREAIPWTAFKYAENLGQFQVIREQAGTFADSIRLWSHA
ncbi:MAG: benzoyl-CoA reductase subunit C [Myxococcales bacterium]|nr:benzoyl-CoA reductase subunit C [Myxococcales bacterium]